MDALLIAGKLVGLDAVSLHVLGVGVTMRAGAGDVRGMYVRSRVRRRAQVVYAVAISAHCDLGISLSPLHAVHTGLVLLELIDTQARIVFLHALGIGVTGSTELRNLP